MTATKVADSATLGSLQPRVRVLEQIARILDQAPHKPSGLPAGFLYFDLACRVYGTAEPTRAQLSAVRRAAARLVATGRAEVDADRETASFAVYERGEQGFHRRRSRKNPRYVYRYANPVGVTIRRVPTDADREAWDAAMKRFFESGSPLAAGLRNGSK